MKIFVTNLLAVILVVVLFIIGIVGTTIMGREISKCQDALDEVKLKLEEMMVDKRSTSDE